MRINGLSGRTSQLPSDKLVSQGFKQFRLRLARGVSKLVGAMEICEIVMESIGKQHPQPIAGLRQVGGRESVQCGTVHGAESRWVPVHWQCRHTGSGAGAVVECQ